MPRRPATGELARRVAAADFDAPRSAFEPGQVLAEAELEPMTPIEPMDDVEAMSAAAPSPEADGSARVRPALAAAATAPQLAPAIRAMHDRRGSAAAAGPMRMAGPPGVARPMRPTPDAHPMRPAPDGEDGQIERTATAPQLRRFIKSRAYVPMHELRRRFGINGGDDEVTPVDLERTRVFVGLPDREGRLLGELLRGGDIGYELSLDPISPIVVGVYPMRPVTRG
jgi:hypothetical protein